MPEVVDKFVKNNDYNEVYRIQESIVKSNEDDIIKYARLREKSKVKNCYLSIPNQLAKENKKFMFSKIEKKATRPKYENSIERLRDAKIVPIEVKAGNNSTLSLNEILKDKNITVGYKLIDGNIGVDGKKVILPHYMALFI